MLHFVLHDSSNPSTNNPLYLNNLHRFSRSLYLYISFYRPYVVKSDGSVCNPVVVEPAHECLNSEAERIIDILPDFTPATNKGKPVNIKLSIPINFRMSPQNH